MALGPAQSKVASQPEDASHIRVFWTFWEDDIDKVAYIRDDAEAFGTVLPHRFAHIFTGLFDHALPALSDSEVDIRVMPEIIPPFEKSNFPFVALLWGRHALLEIKDIRSHHDAITENGHRVRGLPAL